MFRSLLDSGIYGIGLVMPGAFCGPVSVSRDGSFSDDVRSLVRSFVRSFCISFFFLPHLFFLDYHYLSIVESENTPRSFLFSSSSSLSLHTSGNNKDTLLIYAHFFSLS